MPGCFFDTSALVKAYHLEVGTQQVLRILSAPGNEILISSLTLVEIQSAFSQKVREGVISIADYGLLRRRLAADITLQKLRVKNLLRSHQQAAERLIATHATTRRLRTLDALQLGAALVLASFGLVNQFVCSDNHLLEAAKLEGLSVVNPELTA